MTREERREKILSAAATGVVLALIGTALLRGLGVRPEGRIAEALTLIAVPTLTPPPPPPKPEVRKVRIAKAPKAPAPPAPKGRATPVIAPKPPLPVLAPPVVAASRADAGADRSTGAAFAGDGRGAGGRGDGDGGGFGDGDGAIPPEQIGGTIRYADMPAERRAAGITTTTGVRFLVEVNGRVSTCLVTRSSGYPDIDATICGLIRQRFRYRPSRDPDGHRVAAWLAENHSLIHRGYGSRDDDDDAPDER